LSGQYLDRVQLTVSVFRVLLHVNRRFLRARFAINAFLLPGLVIVDASTRLSQLLRDVVQAGFRLRLDVLAARPETARYHVLDGVIGPRERFRLLLVDLYSSRYRPAGCRSVVMIVVSGSLISRGPRRDTRCVYTIISFRSLIEIADQRPMFYFILLSTSIVSTMRDGREKRDRERERERERRRKIWYRGTRGTRSTCFADRTKGARA